MAWNYYSFLALTDYYVYTSYRGHCSSMWPLMKTNTPTELIDLPRSHVTRLDSMKPPQKESCMLCFNSDALQPITSKSPYITFHYIIYWKSLTRKHRAVFINITTDWVVFWLFFIKSTRESSTMRQQKLNIRMRPRFVLIWMLLT